MIASLHNRMARRGRHNINFVWVKRDRATRCMFCFDLHLTLTFLAFYENIRLKEVEVWFKVFLNKINFHACHIRFAILFPHLSCCVSSLIL